MIIADEDIGGARVRRLFSIATRQMRGGDKLTGDEVRNIPIANRRALVDAGYIEIWPRGSIETAERHIVHNGGGRYDVIAGHKINDRPLTKDEAEELATRPN